ncbi:hypothetical protein G9A89_006684 [Geosiphon pyriformis]|nr:hypothetical protein G9A89_006684 [Geosiphon pyriformis]
MHTFEFEEMDNMENIDWVKILALWRMNCQVSTGITSKTTMGMCTYLIKAIHRRLPATKKNIYKANYPNTLCAMCGDSESSGYVFTYIANWNLRKKILNTAWNQ